MFILVLHKKQHRRETLNKSGKSMKRYTSGLVYGNQNSVDKVITNLGVQFQQLNDIELQNMFILVLRKNQHCKETLNK